MAKYKAKQSFGVQFEGEFITIAAGDVVDSASSAGGKLLKQLGSDAIAEHFEEFESFGRFDSVESATKAPGEKRTTRTTKK